MSAIGPQIPIRRLREAHGLTLRSLAERIEAFGVKIDEDHLSNVELGRRRPSKQLSVAWARALGIQPLDVSVPTKAGDVAA